MAERKVINKGVQCKVRVSGDLLSDGTEYTAVLYYNAHTSKFRITTTATCSPSEFVDEITGEVTNKLTCVFVFTPEQTLTLKEGDVIFEVYDVDKNDMLFNDTFAVVRPTSLSGINYNENNTITLTDNGKHIIKGYDYALVDIIPAKEVQNYTITKNGSYSYTPDNDYNSLFVTVDVSVTPMLQHKTLQIDNSKGEWNISPDSGYAGLSSVLVLPVYEQKTFTENGIYAPSENYCGYNLVTVDVQPPLQNKQYIVETYNGSETVTPDEGYYGLNSVMVIPKSLSATFDNNGTYTIPDGYCGYNTVVVDVQPLLEDRDFDLNNLNALVTCSVNSSSYYGMSSVNIYREFESLSITENGTYTANPELAGITQVTVDVQPTLEALQIDVTEKALIEYTPDKSDGYNYVSVRPVTQTKTITTNGTYTADDGYCGFDTITVNIPTQEKSVTYNTNGSFEVTPDSGKDLSKVNVDVDFILDMSNAEGDKSNWFRGCQTSGPLHITNVTNKVTNLSHSMRCPNITELRGTETWDTSQVTSMLWMFSNCKALTSLDLSGWDTSSVTNFQNIFHACTKIQTYNGISKLVTSAATNIASFFAYDYHLQSVDVSEWDTSNVVLAYSVFLYCSELQELDLTKWECGKIYECVSIIRCTPYISSYSPSSLTTVIGSHTLAEVEAGTVVALKDMGKSVATVDYQGTPRLLYASALALFNGLYDKTGATTGTLKFSNTAFNTYTTEQQTTLRTIASNKNYTLTLV